MNRLNSGTENLNLILNSGHNSSSKYSLGFDASVRSIKPTTEIKFVPALVKDETETVPTTTVVSPLAKTTRCICYYCGKKGHIKPFYFKLQRDKWCQRR